MDVRVRSLVFLALVAVVVASACGNSNSGSSHPSSKAAGLDATSWQLVSIRGKAALPGGSLRFDRGRLSGSTGCNTLGGTFEQSGNRLSITVGAITLIGCLPPLGDQEQALLAALGKTAAYRSTHVKLTLLSAGGAELLVYRRHSAG
jgi:heat shock protein HslJ